VSTRHGGDGAASPEALADPPPAVQPLDSEMAVINQVTRINDPREETRETGLAGKPGTRRGTMSNRSKGFRRSAGTVMPLDLVRNRMRAPSQAAQAADIEAVDRGEGRTIACLFRGTYGTYPRRFKQKMLDLTSDSLVLRPFWYGLNRKRVTIPEPVLAAQVRETELQNRLERPGRRGVLARAKTRMDRVRSDLLPNLIRNTGVRRPATRCPAHAPRAPGGAQPGAAGQRRRAGIALRSGGVCQHTRARSVPERVANQGLSGYSWPPSSAGRQAQSRSARWPKRSRNEPLKAAGHRPGALVA
jgi:hypothetical protein